jgi:hypothetical protein
LSRIEVVARLKPLGKLIAWQIINLSLFIHETPNEGRQAVPGSGRRKEV